MSQESTFAIDDTPSSDRLHSELDLYKKIIEAGASEDFWGDVLLSAGYYDDKEYWQQVDAYLDGLFAEAAFGNKLPNRAIEQAKLQLAKHGYNGVDEMTDAMLPTDWSRLTDEEQETLLDIVEKVHPDADEEIAIHSGWESLTDEQRASELARLCEMDADADEAGAYRRRYIKKRGEEIWQKLSTEAQTMVLVQQGNEMESGNAFWRMIAFRHDASMSKGARGWDNLTRRVTEKEVTANEREDAQRLLNIGGDF